MSKFLKIFLSLIILGGLLYFAFPMIRERYFNAEQVRKEDPQDVFMPMDNAGNVPPEIDLMKGPNADSTSPENPDLENFLSGEKTETPKPASTLNTNERNATGKSLTRITTAHCDNDCQAFSIDSKLLEYCQQVCGIAPPKEVSNCDDKNNLEKDYCLKDLAITQKDSFLCGKINDANIKLTCQNRIMEDILES